MKFLTVKRFWLIEILIYFHIFLITIQLVIREIIIDTTFIRDIFLFVILYLWVFKNKNSFHHQKKSKIKTWFIIFLTYGILMVFFQLIMGIGVVESILSFRNYFLPLSLFFVAKSIFETKLQRMRLVKFFNAYFIFLIINVLTASFISYNGFSLDIFPWYRYQFTHSYRYSTSGLDVPGQISPDQSPIIGILGWDHASSATMFGLFSILLPFYVYQLINRKKNYFLLFKHFTNIKIYLIILSFITSLIIFGVKMQLLSLFLICFLLMFFIPVIIRIKFIAYLLFIAVILFLTQQFWLEQMIAKYETAFVDNGDGQSTFSYILDPNIILSIGIIFFTNSLSYLFFGGYDFSQFWFFEMLEIRIINFTLQLGLFWLLFFLCLFLSSFRYAVRLIKSLDVEYFDKIFALGTLLLMCAYFLDMFHYARLMYWPNIDIFAVIIGALSNINIKNGFNKDVI